MTFELIQGKKALKHLPGTYGWSRIGDTLYCPRMGWHNARESGGGLTRSRALFVGTLVHEYLAALFQRIKLQQQGELWGEWIDPWQLMEYHKQTYTTAPYKDWAGAAVNIGQTLLGIPKPGWFGVIPDDFLSLPNLTLWGRTSDKVIAVEEVGTWDLGGVLYQPRLDLVLEVNGVVVGIDWKTTSLPCTEQASPWDEDKVKKHEKNLTLFHGASGQFQAMHRLEVNGRRIQTVRVGKIFAPYEKGPMFKFLKLDAPSESTLESLAESMRHAIALNNQMGDPAFPPPARAHQDRICVSDYGPCKHYKKCHE
jgi:hypothetical protein